MCLVVAKPHFSTLWKSLFQTVFVKKIHNYCMYNQTNNIFLDFNNRDSGRADVMLTANVPSVYRSLTIQAFFHINVSKSGPAHPIDPFGKYSFGVDCFETKNSVLYGFSNQLSSWPFFLFYFFPTWWCSCVKISREVNDFF